MKRLLYSRKFGVFRSVKIVFFSDDLTRFSLYLFLVVPPQKRMPLQSRLNEDDDLIFKNDLGNDTIKVDLITTRDWCYDS